MQNKIIMTFEAYLTYSDYKTKSSEEMSVQLFNDIKISTKHLTPTFDDKWIKDIEDQSDEKKGIKFQVTLSNGEVIHAFKIGRFIGDWELYLNKKKKTKFEIKEYLLSKMISQYERWELNFKSFDSYYRYSDDHRAYKEGAAHEKQIIKLYSELSISDKKKAYKKYTETLGKENPISFLEFKGV